MLDNGLSIHPPIHIEPVPSIYEFCRFVTVITQKKTLENFHLSVAGSVLGQIMSNLWLTKWDYGGFSSSILLSPAYCHSANSSKFFYHPVNDAM
jgi:hypothetical protein